MDLPLDTIDLTDDLFRSSYCFDLEPLILSITTSGILSPLLVKKNKDRYTLINGYRRYCAAKKLGLTSVPVTLWKGTDIEAFQTKLLEDRTVRQFNLIEKALLLRTCRRSDIPTAEIISQYAQFIGIAPKKERIEDHLALLDLEHFWQDRIAQGKILPDTAGILTHWTAAERTALQELLNTYQVNLNKCREFVLFLDEVKLRDGTNLRTLIDTIVRDSEKAAQPDQQFELFRATVRRIRYPHLSSAEKAWNEHAPFLENATGTVIKPPANFEGDTLTIQLTIRSKEALGSGLKKISDSLSDPHWDNVFKNI